MKFKKEIIMFSPLIVSMHGQVIKSELEREIKEYQMLNAVALKKTKGDARNMRWTRLYHTLTEKIHSLSSSKQDEIEIAECA